jgi:ERCC4-type nuclease
MDKKTLFSAMFALQFYKGFSLIKTNTTNETYLFILHYFQKLNKENKKMGYFEEKIQRPIINIETQNLSDNQNLSEKQEIIKSTQNNYCDVIKKSKKSFITKDNIGEIMLSTVPGVSSKSAQIIMKKFDSIKNLINCIEQDEDCLNDIKYETTNGQYRKITSLCIKNIKEYLLNKD